MEQSPALGLKSGVFKLQFDLSTVQLLSLGGHRLNTHSSVVSLLQVSDCSTCWLVWRGLVVRLVQVTPGMSRNWKIRLPLTLSAVCPERRKLIEFSCYHRQVRDIISTFQHKWERAVLKITSSCQVISHLCKTGRFLYRVFLLRLSNIVWHHHHLQYGRGFNRTAHTCIESRQTFVYSSVKKYSLKCFLVSFLFAYLSRLPVSGQTCSIKNSITQNASDKVTQATRKASGHRWKKDAWQGYNVKGFGKP